MSYILKIKTESGNFIPVPALKGEQGIQGPAGEQGPTGEQGPSTVWVDVSPPPGEYDVWINPDGQPSGGYVTSEEVKAYVDGAIEALYGAILGGAS